MYVHGDKELVVKRLKGQKLVIPDMRPIFAHWPCGQNEGYQAMKNIIDKRLAAYVANPSSPPLPSSSNSLLYIPNI